MNKLQAIALKQIPWTFRAQNASVRLLPDALKVRQNPEYPTAELNPDVLKEAFSKFFDAYFIGFQNIRETVGKVLKNPSSERISKTARALYYNTCLRLGQMMQKVCPKFTGHPKGTELFVRSGNYFNNDNLPPHVHNYQGYGIESLGYQPSKSIINNGKLTFWNTEDLNIELAKMLDIENQIKVKHRKGIERFTPLQDHTEYPFFVFIDKAVAHSVSGINLVGGTIRILSHLKITSEKESRRDKYCFLSGWIHESD